MLNSSQHTAVSSAKGLAIDPTIVDSKRLQMFYASVKEGSFAGAAHLLSLSPSAISHAMKSLEEEFGCPLFRRSGPQVRPTGAAIRLLPLVEDLLLRMALMKSELSELDGRSERLVVGVRAGMLGMFREESLSVFLECFPNTNLEISLIDKGSQEKADFEIDYLDQIPGEIVRRDLGTEVYRGYAAPFHRLGQSSRISMPELRKSLLIFPDTQVYEMVSTQIAKGGEGALNRWIIPSPDLARSMAEQGQGIAFLPDWSIRGAVEDGVLVRLNLTGLELRRTYCAWWEATRPLTWTAEVFLNLFCKGTDF